MFAALYVPRPALQALLVEQPDIRHQPAVVLDDPEKVTTSKQDRGKLRVIEISAEAEEFGIYHGMTAVQAQARCDYLHLLNKSPQAEAQLTETLLTLAEQFTPDFENTRLGVCLLDLGGVAAIETEALALADDLHERLSSATDNSHTIGIAPNPDLALLAARASDFNQTNRLVVQKNDITNILSPLPLEVLDLAPAMAELFQLWGIQNLGQLVQLGRAELVTRLGQETGQLWDRAAGKSHRLLHIARPITDYSGSLDLDYEVTTLDPLLFLMRRLLDTIVARLQSAYLVAAKLSLRLEFADGNLYQRMFRIPEPCCNVDLLVGILKVHLENFEARAPIHAMTLRAIPTRPGKHQFDLFAAGIKDPNRLSETLARVEALLGSERFGVPRLKPTHRPDSFSMHPFTPEKECSTTVIPKKLLDIPRLPMKRLRPRRHIQAIVCPSTTAPQKITSGDFKGWIQQARGPYVISGNWWEKRSYWSREEWDIEHQNGRLYRLAKEQDEWFVEAVGG